MFCNFPARLVLVITAAVLLGTAEDRVNAQVVVAPLTPQIGSAQPATATPRVERPQSTPCVVNLFNDQKFDNFDDKLFAFSPPAECPGPWRKVVFTSDFTVTAGRQFDRTAKFSVGGAILYFGTTAEPRSTLSPSWHVERDVTDLSAIFRNSAAGKASLGNFVGTDSGITYDGIIYVNAALEFYPASFFEPAPRVPDLVIPIPGDGNSSSLETSDSVVEKTLTLPQNVEKAYLDVIAQSQGADEFWWTCVPNDVATTLQSCGGTAFREAQARLDGEAAGIVPLYPWIYTGGVSPSLWAPIPGVQTYNFEPFRVDLTPFAGLLSNGDPHTIGLNVFNANHRFEGEANLLIYLDPFAARVFGRLTQNTLSPAPMPNVQQDVNVDDNGDVTASVNVDSSREYRLSGFVTTSHGPVETNIRTTVGFLNSQQFTINDSLYSQHIAQSTDMHVQTETRSAWIAEIEDQDFSFPLSFIYDYAGGADYAISSFQKLISTDRRSRLGRVIFSRQTSDEVSTQVGNPGRTSSQTFTTRDSFTRCKGRRVISADGLVTDVQDGAGCETLFQEERP